MREPRARPRKIGLRWKLALLPFRSAALREVALWSSKAAYRTCRWLGSGWRATVLLVLAVSFLWWGWHALRDMWRPSLAQLLEPAAMAQVLIMASLLALVRWALRARRRIVLESFQDFTGEDGHKELVEGLSSQLLEKMELIAELYRKIDEGWPSPVGGKNVIEATAMVESPGEQLQGVLSSTSEVHLGPLKIPVGALLLPLSRLLRGPRITGSVHLQGDQPLLLARFEGRGSFQWSVTPADLEQGEATDFTALVGRMIKQLACRVLTDLIPIGSSRWRAVLRYTRGLSYWRKTLGTQKDRNRHLRHAEAAFIAALGEDNDFARCHYNLGIVYQALGDNDAASASFRRAVQADPEQVDAWYALAHRHYGAKQFEDVVRLCERAIELHPDDPRSWNLRSLAQQQNHGEEQSLGTPEFWEAIIRTLATATALAWKALVHSALRGRREPRTHETAVYCTRNLAVAQAYRGRKRRAEVLFRQALRLAPNSADIHFELGKARCALLWPKAIQALEEAARIEDNALTWAWLAKAYARAASSPHLSGAERGRHRTAAYDACRRALDGSSDSAMRFQEMGEQLFEAYKLLNDEQGQRRMAFLWLMLDPQTLKRREDESLATFQQRLMTFVRVYPSWDWLHAQVEIQLGTAQLKEDPQMAEKRLHLALRLIQEHYPKEVRTSGLYGLLALAYLEQKKPMIALEHARRAVSLDPESAWERSILGDIYLRLNDFELAEREWQICLALQPDEKALKNLVTSALGRGIAQHEPTRRRELFTQVITYLHGVLEQEPKEPGYAHYWLGWLYEDLLQYDNAIYHYNAAQRMGYKPLEAYVRIAWNCRDAHAWEDAEEAVRNLRTEAYRWYRTARASEKRPEAYRSPPQAPGENVPINEELALAWMVRAFCWADREANLARAERVTRNAERGIERVVDAAQKTIYLAVLTDCRGWIHCKQGALDEAIPELEQSVALFARGETYYRLAYAYLARAELSEEERTEWLSKSRSACRHARELDLPGAYSRELSDLEHAIDTLSDSQPPRYTVRARSLTAPDSNWWKRQKGAARRLLRSRRARRANAPALSAR